MALDIQPVAFRRQVAFAIELAPTGGKRVAGYAAMASGIGAGYQIRLLRDAALRATYSMNGALPYTEANGLAPTAATISSVSQTGAIDLSSGTWTVEIASTQTAGYKITGTLGTSGTDFLLTGVLPVPAP